MSQCHRCFVHDAVYCHNCKTRDEQYIGQSCQAEIDRLKADNSSLREQLLAAEEALKEFHRDN